MSSGASKRTGFTIVELLIVIVVIGILAAITIVAYNGITNKANIASVQSDLDNAKKQLGIDQTNTGSFPATTAAANGGAGLAASAGTTYQYIVNTNVSPQTYCLAATKGSATYYITDSNGVPSPGSCTDAALVAEWKFNGNANDATSHGYNGALVGTPTLTTGQNGSANGAYSFSGSGQYISFGNSTAFNSSDITMSAWIKPTTVSGIQEILAKEMQYKVRMDGPNIDVLIGANGTSWTTTVTAAPGYLTVGSWSLVTTTISSSSNTVVVYINGTQTGSYTLTNPIVGYNTNSLYAAAYNTSGTAEMFSGSMDDARIYNRALTSAEVQAIYNNGAQ